MEQDSRTASKAKVETEPRPAIPGPWSLRRHQPVKPAAAPFPDDPWSRTAPGPVRVVHMNDPLTETDLDQSSRPMGLYLNNRLTERCRNEHGAHKELVAEPLRPVIGKHFSAPPPHRCYGPERERVHLADAVILVMAAACIALFLAGFV